MNTETKITDFLDKDFNAEIKRDRLFIMLEKRFVQIVREKPRESLTPYNINTKFQEYLRKNGIKEHKKDEPYDHDKYTAISHPAPWTCEFYYQCSVSLLVPKELAIKILTLGTMP